MDRLNTIVMETPEEEAQGAFEERFVSLWKVLGHRSKQIPIVSWWNL